MKALLTICLFSFTFFTHSQIFEYAKQIGGMGDDAALSTITDAVGNVYITGYYEETVDFDPGPAVTNIMTNGNQDMFIEKFDPSGNLIWIKTLGGPLSTAGSDIFVDEFYNVYLTGNFRDTVDFDPGIDTYNLTCNGGTDLFVLKLNASGDFIFAQSFGGAEQDIGKSIKVDNNGNIIIMGSFRNVVDFDPGVGTANLISNGNDDVFILKLDGSGAYIWAKSFGGVMHDSYSSMVLDDFGNIITCGFFKGTLDIDPDISVFNIISQGNNDIYILKLDSSGSFIWANSIGSTNSDNGYGVCSDNFGNIYVTGFYTGTVDFDPSSNTYLLAPPGGSFNAFVLKLDSLGNFIWVRSWGGGSVDAGHNVKLDLLGNIYISGLSSNYVDFDPGSGVAFLSSSGNSSTFLLKLDSSGNYLWARVLSMAFSQNCDDRALNIDYQGNIYISGDFDGTIDFNPNSGINNFTTPSIWWDIYILKLSPCSPISTIDYITACDSLTWIDGNTYYSSNSMATHTIPNFQGCDSIITLNLTIINSSTGIDVQTVCDSLLWIDGNTYYTSTNTPSHYLLNMEGCDSLVTLNLMVNSNSGIDNQTACDNFTWIDGNTYFASNNTATYMLTNSLGCDSIVTLNLDINYSDTLNDIITECDSYTWIDGITYNATNNNATHTFSNINNCDSVLTLDLTINYSDNITQVLTACDSFTWIDGNTYTNSNNIATFLLTNSSGCDSLVSLNLTINPSPIVNTNLFTLPSDQNSCTGVLSINATGDFSYLHIIDGQTSISSNGQLMEYNICTGVHDLSTINSCGDSLQEQFVIATDSNFVFNNPFLDSLAMDSLGLTLNNCTIYYNSIDTAYIDSIWTIGNQVNVIWNIVDSSGFNLDTTVYNLNNGTGVYWLQLSIFCPNKSTDYYFVVSQAIYFDENGAYLLELDKNQLNDFALNLYPNPTNDNITIQYNSSIQSKIKIFNTHGQLIMVQNLYSGEKLSLINCIKGIYFVSIELDGFEIVKKLIKN